MESDLELAFAELVGTLANTVVESAGGGVPDLPTDLPIDSLIALATGDGIGELPVESMTDGSTVLDPFEDLI
jgi:hypothetical protein